MDLLSAIGLQCLVWGGVMLLALAVERLQPIRPPMWADARLNLAYLIVYAAAGALASAAISGGTVALVNRAGGGWIALQDGPGSLLLYAILLDGLEYAFHRAQHRFPALWAMHSLHHSDPAMNASTTIRHFWLEPAIKMVTIYPLAGLIFKAPPALLGMYAILGLYNVVPHMNLRVPPGRWWWLMNGPAYHRIHHSVEERHMNRNFAALFPLYDIIFGTACEPREDEWPDTGLADGQRPAGIGQVVAWPLIGAASRAARSTSK
jgi:sterol desaturase/sphingolipid hydroxylase (fatty acid hydroxylase superfamily)